MPKDNHMYELEYPGPSLDTDTSGDGGDGLSLVIALQGYADAGHGVQQAGQHLLQALNHSAVANFNVDELIDYRSRRPGITIDSGKVVDREDMSITLHRVEDTDGRPFLLLTGPEPDLRWEAFAKAVAELAARTNVERTITLYAAPMTVPHTRPLVISAHSSDPSLTKDLRDWNSRMIIPGAASLDIELLLGRRGKTTVGLTAHVPHYIAASDYPEATYGLLHSVEKVAELSLPLRALQADMEKVRQQLAEQVDDSAEIASVVGALERQYDDEMARIRRKSENSLLAPGEQIPSGDEIGAEFEQFLAEAAETDDTDGAEDPGADTDTDTDSDR
ncbi:MAG TPA: PAC2 family protein [Candidatus Corynebacterium avicola]|uniref:PAC2 family protein n=1 Tax=Candidatus Corynebacterium avicola TaxID=2838527 RepID=A0A9D1RQQ6_9CORY|nr:PAC2 family protein [Candidatus Corynebacterium avicola]